MTIEQPNEGESPGSAGASWVAHTHNASDGRAYALFLVLAVLWALLMPRPEVHSFADLHLLPTWSEAMQVVLVMLAAVFGLSFALRKGYNGVGVILCTVAIVLSATVFR